MNEKYNLITPENIQGELIKNEIELNNLRVQSFKEQKYNELLRENKQLKHRIKKAIEITYMLLQNSADNQLIAKAEEMEYFEWLDETLEKQLKILKVNNKEEIWDKD